jgi:hypothetical protein
VLGDAATNPAIRAASLYNTATLRADRSFAEGTPEQEEVILAALFTAKSAEALMHDLLEGPFNEETEVLSIMLNGAERLRLAQLDLQAALRINGKDEDIRRNLELVTKRRIVLLAKLAQIRRYYAEKSLPEEEEEALSEQGIINLFELEMPEETEESTSWEDRGYMILERF